jgi:hypothetical protein
MEIEGGDCWWWPEYAGVKAYVVVHTIEGVWGRCGSKRDGWGSYYIAAGLALMALVCSLSHVFVGVARRCWPLTSVCPFGASQLVGRALVCVAGLFAGLGPHGDPFPFSFLPLPGTYLEHIYVQPL